MKQREKQRKQRKAVTDQADQRFLVKELDLRYNLWLSRTQNRDVIVIGNEQI